MLLQGQETLSGFLPFKQRGDEGSPSFCGDTRYLEPLDTWGSPGGSAVKNTPAVQETWARSLGQEDPLEKEMATHCSYFWLQNVMDGAWRATVHRVTKESDTT